MHAHTPRRAAPGETVLVTGASSGIGRDAALHLSDLGYRVAAGVRRAADGERLAGDASRPDLIHPVIVDVTDADQVADAARTVAELVAAPPQGGPGGLTALFSNAGIAELRGDTSCEGCPIEVQERVMQVNHFGAVRITQAVLPLLRASQGRVVVNTALMARLALPFNAGYAASKSALESWMDSLRREVAPHGVRVSMIEAAAIASSLTAADADVVDDGPYPEQHAFHAFAQHQMADHDDDPACSPRRFSEKVVEAIQSPRPRRRYVVGGGSRPLDVVSHLPAPVQDRVMQTMVRRAARTT